MAKYIQVTTTTGTRHDAEQIASELVSRRLAACVQITGPINSTFRWQGKVETAEEWMCTIKTTGARLDAIQKLFREIHPYEVPEIIATPIEGGGDAYLKWLAEQVAESQSETG
jgi:periplasmic divalent cation tolerance protein